MPRVVISGYYGFGNWGDEAILEAAASGLRAAIPGLEITVLSQNPVQTAARHGLSAVHRSNPVSVVQAVRSADLLVSGGGSLLQDATSSRSLWYYLAIIEAGVALGKPVMLYANGVGPIDRMVNRGLARRILNNVSLITVRGPRSERLLHELGVSRPPIVLTADSAFGLEPATPAQVAAMCAAEGLPDVTSPDSPPFIAIAGRPWRGTQRLEGILAEAADHIAGKLGYGVLFLPVHREVDLPMAERVRAAMRRPSHLLSGHYSGRQIVGLISHLRWVLSLRLHPLIFAAAGGIPAIGLVYDPKVEEFLSEAEQVSLGQVQQVGLRDILRGIDEVESEYGDRVARLAKVVQGFRERAKLNNSLAADLLRDGR